MKLISKQQGFLKAQVPKERWVVGSVVTGAGSVPQIKTALEWKDRLGAYKVRWGMNRMGYKVNPGLYAVGNPVPESPVLVSANYKLTFDRVRKNFNGLNVWLLILDTRGVNVWCAAGKGTFGTKELVNRIKKTALDKVVSHRQLILPQLGAVGVSAAETAKGTGFKVSYGPVRIEDIKEYFNA
ncbi:MAG: acetyl-CoA synthase subunit gamma, partial [Spirochaetae bacterium HGW-Spirochaetae-6]